MLAAETAAFAAAVGDKGWVVVLLQERMMLLQLIEGGLGMVATAGAALLCLIAEQLSAVMLPDLLQPAFQEWKDWCCWMVMDQAIGIRPEEADG